MGVGRDIQSTIFRNGATGLKPAIPAGWSDLESAAEKAMSREAWAYVKGSAGNESTEAANWAPQASAPPSWPASLATASVEVGSTAACWVDSGACAASWATGGWDSSCANTGGGTSADASCAVSAGAAPGDAGGNPSPSTLADGGAAGANPRSPHPAGPSAATG